MARDKLTKKIRFEVFKRDGFRCQYCGRESPEVKLEVDHIEPVSKGGTNEIFNLVTACFDCNRGKSNRELDDNAVVVKQKAQADVVNERRLQLEMAKQWVDELKEFEEEAAGTVEDFVNEMFALHGHECFAVASEGKKGISKWIKKYDLEILIESIKAAFNQYDEPERIFEMIPRIASIKASPESEKTQQIFYIRGIINNKVIGGLDRNEKVECRQMLTYISQEFDLDDIQASVQQANLCTWRQAKYYLQGLMPYGN